MRGCSWWWYLWDANNFLRRTTGNIYRIIIMASSGCQIKKAAHIEQPFLFTLGEQNRTMQWLFFYMAVSTFGGSVISFVTLFAKCMSGIFGPGASCKIRIFVAFVTFNTAILMSTMWERSRFFGISGLQYDYFRTFVFMLVKPAAQIKATAIPKITTFFIVPPFSIRVI